MSVGDIGNVSLDLSFNAGGVGEGGAGDMLSGLDGNEMSLIDLLMELLAGEEGEAGGGGDAELGELLQQLAELLGGGDEEGMQSDPCACSAEDGAKAGGEAGGLDDLLGGGFEDLLSDAFGDLMDVTLGELLSGGLAELIGGDAGAGSVGEGSVITDILGNDNNVSVDFNG